MNGRLRSVTKIFIDASVIWGAAVGAFVLHADQWPLNWPKVELCSTLVTITTVTALWLFGVYRSLWRYASIRDIVRAAFGITCGSVIYCFASPIIGCNIFTPRVAITEGALAMLLIGMVRVAVRLLIFADRPAAVTVNRRNVIILGSGNQSAAIARDLINARNGRKPIGFIDNDPCTRGRMIHGLPVLGEVRDIPTIAAAKNAEELIIGEKELPPELCGEVVSACADAGIRLRILPSLPDLLGKSNGHRNGIDPQSLLGRPVLPVDESEIEKLVKGKRILISGAGGSIGSELCRQIAKYSPDSLYMLDQCENGVFELDQELKDDANFPITPIVADVKDMARLDQVFSVARPSLVIHAAAHKHVPLMESYPEESVKNNILGTLSIASTAAKHGVDKFVLISTDKAVRPSSVMGASKRVAEMIVQDIAGSSSTKFVTVRFGNVLGSSGSVIPVMQRQILRGGPVTVTHPDMTRFFMTIPEAVRLVLIAANNANSGDLMILDMGKPARIMDLANLLIRLSGHTPGEDMEVRFTGIRPGEKLYEELLTDNESTKARKLGSILTSRTEIPVTTVLHKAILRLEALAVAGDREGIRRELKSLVPEYTGFHEDQIAISR